MSGNGRLWDHLIQDVDAAKPNYGVVADHPELVDINIAPTTSNSWDHANSMSYNPQRDEIVMSCRKFNEVLVIDHSTTIEEAAGHTGGNRGMGGDILYRWGNPQNYDRGTAEDRFFINVHGGIWIDACLPGGGNILAFNNGDRGGADNYSSVEEIVPPMDAQGNYIIEPGKPFGPAAPVWSFSSGPGFFARRQGGAFRMPNGNTLITDPEGEQIFEVTREKELVWFYFTNGSVHRAPRYWSKSAVTLQANFDINPRGCPNPFNIAWIELAQSAVGTVNSRKGGLLPAAIVGDECIDVSEINVSTLRMGGLTPLLIGYEDVARPAGDAQCACTTGGPDGVLDLELKFSRIEVALLLGSAGEGDVVPLRITGFMNDGSPIEGSDCIVVMSKSRDAGIPNPGVDVPSYRDEQTDEELLLPVAAVPTHRYATTLLYNSPNPFNPTTTIRFTLEKAMNVTLSIFDAKGRRVVTLIEDVRSAGPHDIRWDGTDAAGSSVSSGVYFYRMIAGKTVQSRRMVLLK